MKTEKFSLASATDTWIRNGKIRVLRYDSGDAGGPTPTIRVTSQAGSDIDLEMVPGRVVTLPVHMDGLVIRSLAGAGITGKFTWGDGSVTDNTFSGSFDLTTATQNALINAKYNVRPEVHNGDFKSMAVLASNVSETIFAPGVNTNGAILLSGEISSYDSASFPNPVMVAKAGAPANPLDGVIYLASKLVAIPGANSGTAGTLPKEQFIPAGLGLYFISSGGFAANQCLRTARYRLL